MDRKTVPQVAARPDALRVEVAPNPRELLERYRHAATSWDQSVSMRVEFDYSLVYQGRDFRHWKYDLTHRRDGDRCEWFGRCQYEGKDDDGAYSHNEEFRQLVSADFYLDYRKRDDRGGDSDAIIGIDVKGMLLTLQTQSHDGGFLQGRTGGIGKATHLAEAMAESNALRYLGHLHRSGSETGGTGQSKAATQRRPLLGKMAPGSRSHRLADRALKNSKSLSIMLSKKSLPSRQVWKNAP